MANEGNMTLRIKPELKEQVAALFLSFEMDLSTVTVIFHRQALRYYGLPFEVHLDKPNQTIYATMEAAEEDEEIYGPFDSVYDLMEAFNV